MSDTPINDEVEAAVFDFDEWRSAHEDEAPKPKQVKLAGEFFTLPARLPASFMLVYSELTDLEPEAQMGKALDIFQGILGDQYEEILDLIDLGELPVMLNGIVALYEVDPGKLPELDSSSANRSERRKRTSKGSTAKTSRR